MHWSLLLRVWWFLKEPFLFILTGFMLPFLGSWTSLGRESFCHIVMTGRKTRALQVPAVVPCKALGKFPKLGQWEVLAVHTFSVLSWFTVSPMAAHFDRNLSTTRERIPCYPKVFVWQTANQWKDLKSTHSQYSNSWSHAWLLSYKWTSWSVQLL